VRRIVLQEVEGSVYRFKKAFVIREDGTIVTQSNVGDAIADQTTEAATLIEVEDFINGAKRG
jgi:hypothetical protein